MPTSSRLTETRLAEIRALLDDEHRTHDQLEEALEELLADRAGLAPAGPTSCPAGTAAPAPRPATTRRPGRRRWPPTAAGTQRRRRPLRPHDPGVDRRRRARRAALTPAGATALRRYP
ncbi:hypothetical protein O1L60_45295 [Streptomyces diastatochromogenes]|nr:hypothetical protein [Streptomyces diastatochromogenes]